MDPRHLSRLREEQRKAVEETKEKIEKYEKFRSDYQALQQRLKTLPDKLSHDVMVPFGKFAFMPGHIVHTNEILVLLGDNWFVERSAKQAYHIADRRIHELDKRIKELQEQHDLLTPRLGVTSELQAEAQGFGDVKEIVEEYDEDKERLWDEQHRKNLRRLHAEQMKEKIATTDEASKMANATAQSSQTSKSDKDLWNRLDALEREEAEKGEMNSSFEEENVDEQKSRDKISGRRVSWVDEKVKTGDEDSNEDSDDLTEDENEEYEAEDSDEDNHEISLSGKRKTITFSHTKTASANKVNAPADALNINSPADIYKVFAPKSILKKSRSDAQNEVETRTSQQPLRHLSEPKKTSFGMVDNGGDVKAMQPAIVETKHLSNVGEEKAFTGVVVEKSSSGTAQGKSDLQGQQSGIQETKRVSKFKAQRMKQTSS